jgi:hypothetical protein
MTDFRAELQRLVDAYDEHGGKWPDHHEQALFQAVEDARAALAAQPEPVAPTDEALANFTDWFCRNYPGPDTIIHKPEWHAPKVFRAVTNALARWGTPANHTSQEDYDRG